MSNKERLQEHNSKIGTNNATLLEVLDVINKLPSGGGFVPRIKTTYLIKDGVFQEPYQYKYTDGSSSSYGGIAEREGYVALISKTWSAWQLSFRNHLKLKKGTKVHLEFSKKAWKGINAQYQGVLIGSTNNSSLNIYIVAQGNQNEFPRQTSDFLLLEEYDNFIIQVVNLCSMDLNQCEPYAFNIYNLWIEEETEEFEEKIVDITENGQTIVEADRRYHRALSKVTINTNIEDKMQGEKILARTDGTITTYAPKIGNYGLAYYENLATLNLPETTTVGNYGLYQNVRISTLNAPKLKSLGDYALANTQWLVNLSLPELETVGSHTFQNAYRLATVDFPKLKTVGGYFLEGLERLTNTKLYLPSVETLNAYALTRGTSVNATLTELKFDKLSKMNSPQFYNQAQTPTNLKDFINYYDGVCTLGSTTVASNFRDWTPNIYFYFPDNRVDEYKANTNWQPIANKIHSISELELLSMNLHIEPLNIKYNRQVKLRVTYNTEMTRLYVPEQEGYTLSTEGKATVQDGVVILDDDVTLDDEVYIIATSTYNNEISTREKVETFIKDAEYTIELNDGQWVDSGTTVGDYIVYKSDKGSYHIASGKSLAKITLFGYSKFVLYIRSNAESSYDYTETFELDATAKRQGGKYTTRGKQSATVYTKCEYTIPDSAIHTIEILYSKDGSGDTADDRGYFYVALDECEYQ